MLNDDDGDNLSLASSSNIILMMMMGTTSLAKSRIFMKMVSLSFLRAPKYFQLH